MQRYNNNSAPGYVLLHEQISEKPILLLAKEVAKPERSTYSWMTPGTSTSGRSLCFRTISRFCCIARITATSGHPYGRIRSERYSFNLKKIEDT